MVLRGFALSCNEYLNPARVQVSFHLRPVDILLGKAYPLSRISTGERLESQTNQSFARDAGHGDPQSPALG